MGAAADCELIRAEWLGQPVNTVTTIAFVVAGLLLIRRPPVRWVGIGLIATGVGSFLFHGPMPPASEWAHDVSLAWLLLLVAGVGQTWEHWTRLSALIGTGLLFWLIPALADPIAVLATALAVVLLLRRDRSITTLGPLTLLAASAILGRMGATGWPLCDPSSWFQLHGIWHIAAAGAVTWWALTFSSR